ncbi:ankyrin repeat-containing domain protein [Lactarius deliciosus]|nr:ankyrin repeat-containing domain protein [Lactarius deliciosus]
MFAGRQLRESLRKWQSPSDPSMNHVIASYCQHEGTAEWFCKGNIFEEWKATGSLLWIHGKPGSGKSILCSAIINDIATLHKAGSAYMAYFYFDFRDVDKQSRRDLLRSLLIQLSARSDPFCDVLSRLYAEHDDGTRQPSDNALMHCLKEMLTLPNQPPVYLIMDALDECPNTSGIPSVREQVLDVVKELVGLRLSSLRICATSRPEVDIRYAIEPLTFCSISIHEEVGQEKDIIEYIKSVVHSPSSTIMKRWRDEDKDMVVKTLSERADGMFRWVFCQLETLQHCFPHNIPHILRQLPATLDETYTRVLKEIGKTNQIYAHRLLQCLTVARRPLGVDELAEILALDFEAGEGTPELKENWRWKDEQEAVLSTCSSLIVVVQGHGHRVVQFSHFSVKEFLTSDRLVTSSADISRFHILPEPAHTVTAKACLGILLRSQNGVDGPDTRSGSPLTEYAAEHWVDHARFEKVSLRIEDAIRLLFDAEKPHLEAWLKIRDPDDPYPWDFLDYDDNKHLGSPLYYASLYGFRDLAAHLVTENPQYLTGLVGRNPSPLAAALSKKHFDVAELLYQRGMDLGIRDIHNGTLLHAASRGGYVDIVQWLFDHGVPANSQRDNHETPAEANWRQGRGITVDEAYDTNHTPLHSASRGGHFEIVRQLLVRGADVTAKTQRHWSPLHLASNSRDVETVRLLIEHGADVTARDRRHKTPLHSVSILYDEFVASHSAQSSTAPETVRLLIDHGADVTALDITHSTPLHLASSLYIPEIVQILIDAAQTSLRKMRHNQHLYTWRHLPVVLIPCSY